VTLQDEVEALKALVPEEDQRYLPFNEEIARERRRTQAAPTYARKASGSLNDFRYGFRSIEALEIDPNTNQPYTHPPPEEAHKLLSRLANDIGIVAILKKYEWRVGILGELAPTLETGIVGFSDHCLLGLNVNKGEKILLRLRTSPDPQNPRGVGSFRPYLSIRETLVHEITHMRYGPEHDHNFWGLFRVLMRESQELDWSQVLMYEALSY